MKKIVVFAAFLLLILGKTSGQGLEGDIRFGIQLSPSFGWLTTNDIRINRSGTNLGLKLAMLSEYYFQENYALTSGIGFHFNGGGKLQHDFGGTYWPNSDLGPGLDTLVGGVNLKYNLQYVEIPVGLKMRTREFGYFRYYIEPALTLGIRSQARGTIEGRGVGAEAEKIDITGEVGALNLSWGIGGGLEYNLSESTSLVAGLALQVGFTDVTKDNGTYLDDRDPANVTPRKENSKAKFNALTLRLGILF